MSTPGSAVSMGGACYHMDLEQDNDEITFFPGHLDKSFVNTAWFVPLGTSSFYTIIAISINSDQEQDPDSLRSFEEWSGGLSIRDLNKVKEFLNKFDVGAKKSDGNVKRRLIFLNKPGSILSFPANECYHATIIPKKPSGYPRDLMIFHPLDGIS